MVDNRIREYGKNTKNFEKDEQDSIFFFLYKREEIKAFGMLKPVVLYYKDKKYPIMGVANVMAIEKSKGYGTKIMNALTDYLEENNLAAVGNTYVDNFVFYEKCGYTFFPPLIERMFYKTPEGKEKQTERENYNMFVYDSKSKLKEIINGKGKIIIKVPFW